MQITLQTIESLCFFIHLWCYDCFRQEGKYLNTYFDDLLTFPLVEPWGWHFCFWVKCVNSLHECMHWHYVYVCKTKLTLWKKRLYNSGYIHCLLICPKTSYHHVILPLRLCSFATQASFTARSRVKLWCRQLIQQEQLNKWVSVWYPLCLLLPVWLNLLWISTLCSRLYSNTPSSVIIKYTIGFWEEEAVSCSRHLWCHRLVFLNAWSGLSPLKTPMGWTNGEHDLLNTSC